MRILYYGVIALLFTCQTPLLFAQPQDVSFTTWSSGYDEPLDLTHAGDERIFVVEKRGIILVVDQQGNRNGTPFLDIRNIVNDIAGERGLLGLAFHPNYQENGYFFVNYTNNGGSTIIARYSVSSTDPDVADATSEVILMTISQPFSNHNGGCIKFGADGYLYIGMGDGGSGGDPINAGQSDNTLLGKMLRINVNGGSPYSIPPDNPYLLNSQIPDEVWGFGLRNPWRFSFDRINGDLWIGDVGQNTREEIDYWAGNASSVPNFGWRCYEGNSAFNTSGCNAMGTYDFPVFDYDNNSLGCSVTGGYVYRGPRYGNLWGLYIFCDYCSGRVWYTEPDGNGGWTTTQFDNLTNFNYASFGEDVYGQMYLLGISNGTILKMSDTTCTPVAYVDAPATLSQCSSEPLRAYADPTLDYQWQLNGSDIPGATSADYFAAASGSYRVVVSNGSCADTSSAISLTLIPAPTVQISGLDTVYCANAAAVTISGSPTGGTYSGPGVTGSTFDPAQAGAGLHPIVYAYTDGSTNCTGYDTLLVRVDACTGVPAATLFAGYQFYPNPTRDNFLVEFVLDHPDQLHFEVMNAQGVRVLDQNRDLSAGAQKLGFELGDVADGLYFLHIRSSVGEGVQKFVVRK
ncbi:MAG: PQQ-dependent sugar dehydrogenase [Bacteroidota bacterium]